MSGANRGFGLDMALVLIDSEVGAQVIYCVDVPAEPGEEWRLGVVDHVGRVDGCAGRLPTGCCLAIGQAAATLPIIQTWRGHNPRSTLVTLLALTLGSHSNIQTSFEDLC